jgi:MYXO-CTERM domain-containing protein
LPNGFSTGGVQSLDFVWSPSPQIFPAAFGFSFGSPVTTFMFVSTWVAALGGQGVAIAPGTHVLGDFEFQLLGYRVLDANDNEILGANVASGFLAAPEPAPALLAAAGLALIVFRRRR